MYLLIQKSTNVVADIQPQPFPVTEDFEWVEDKSVDNRTQVGATYNEQTKEFIARQRQPDPRDPVADKFTAIETKLEQLETKGEKEPVLGVSREAQPPSVAPLLVIVGLCVIILILLIKRR